MMIGGSGRSGTTILNRTFARHPRVTDVPEWRFTTDPDGVVDFYTQATRGVRSPFHYDVRVRRLAALLEDVTARGPLDAVFGSARARSLSQRIFGRNLAPAYARTDATSFSPNFKELSAGLVARLTSVQYSAYWVGMHPLQRTSMSYSDATVDEIRASCRWFLEAVAADVCRHQGTDRHLEKNTWNILCWNRTLEILPDAKLVHIVRDPRDVVASYSDQPWVPEDPVIAAQILVSIMDEWDEIARSVPSDSYRVVRLEDLTNDPANELRALCEFWDLDWHPDLLGSGLSSASFGRWKTDLSATERDDVCGIVKHLVERYGYA